MWYNGNVVRLVRPKFILQFPMAALLITMMGFWVAGETARVDDSGGEAKLDVGTERRVLVGHVWVCGACLGTEYVE